MWRHAPRRLSQNWRWCAVKSQGKSVPWRPAESVGASHQSKMKQRWVKRNLFIYQEYLRPVVCAAFRMMDDNNTEMINGPQWGWHLTMKIIAKKEQDLQSRTMWRNYTPLAYASLCWIFTEAHLVNLWHYVMKNTENEKYNVICLHWNSSLANSWSLHQNFN